MLSARLSGGVRVVPRRVELGGVVTGGVAVGLAIAVMFLPAILNDGDTYWHVAAGEWMLDHRQIVRTDPFSSTVRGQPWTAHEWLAEVLMALAYRGAGWSGVMALTAAAVGIAAFLWARRVQPWLAPASLTLTTFLVAYCAAPSLLARPHVLAWPVVVAWVCGMMAARERDRAPSVALLPLMTFWANLHGSFILGFVLMAPFALEALAEARDRRWRVIRDWGLFGLAAVGAALLTPHGVHGFVYPVQLMRLDLVSSIQEWQPADFSQIGPFEIGLLLFLYVALTRRIRAPLWRLLLVLGLLHMALQHGRHQALLAIVGVLVFAEPLGRGLDGDQRPRIWRWSASPAWIAALGAVLVAATALRLGTPVIIEDRPTVPVAALAHTPPELRRQRVLNEYSFGGWLIHNGVRPFIDGRSDMYGDPYFAAYAKALKPDPVAFDALVKRYDIRWTILAADNESVPFLDRNPGWRRLYGDKYAVVHVRVDAHALRRAKGP